MALHFRVASLTFYLQASSCPLWDQKLVVGVDQWHKQIWHSTNHGICFQYIRREEGKRALQGKEKTH